MPKVIDKYVLEQQIGKGQFGQVFRGKHQETLQEVAIKSICRERIKGKFYELLENEIKVLKTCDNPFIIKLHTLKKTPHNYYLMLEYCNGGDMLAKVRKDGLLPQDEVIKYLCQILNAFQTLVKHKIMHRDFKLANILLHNGNIKIADFGFAKLLSSDDYATTILGSPLNMAPEVLGGNQYNNKADIWSIGACIYEMLYGKPPYVANNMVDLVKLIRSKPLTLPSEIKVCEELKDVLRRMLTADIKRRIEWRDLFNHPVTSYLSHKRKSEVELELAEDESLIINTSKCYLRNNLVLSNLGEIKSKSEVNDYLVDIIRHGKKTTQLTPTQTPSIHKDSSRTFKANSKRILHYRNIYAFLTSIADMISHSNHLHHQIAAYVVFRKIISMIEWIIKLTTQDQCPLQGVQNWKDYKMSQDFQQIEVYITKELQVFSTYNTKLQPVIKKKSLLGDYDPDVKQLISGTLKQATYAKYLRKFLLALAGKVAAEALSAKSIVQKEEWKLLFYGLKIVKVEETFGCGERQFDFGQFYELFSNMQEERMLLEVESLISINK